MQYPVPPIVNLTVPAAVGTLGAPANFVLKVIYPVSQLTTPLVAVSDPARAPVSSLITHQFPANGTMLDAGGTVTAILSGVSV